MIIILNENEMSISKNIGSFARHLSKIRSKTEYFRAKSVTGKVLTSIPLIGKPIFGFIQRVKRTFKNFLYGSNYFEDLGLYYLGPVDGNNEEDMEELLREAARLNRSVIIHAKTKKGKGDGDAEENPWKYHSVPPKGAKSAGVTFSEKLGELITKRAETDEKIVAITAAMSYGTGIESFHEKFPERFFDVGIAEEHAVTFAAGLCAAGYKPIVPIYSTFMQRAYDNIIHDVALQRLPVVFCSDRAGLNFGDGATHHGIFDVAFFSEIPGIKIYTPITFECLELALDAALADNCPSVIRYPNSGENDVILKTFYSGSPVKLLGVRTFGNLENTVLIVHGRMALNAVEAQKILALRGIDCGIILAEFIRPFSLLEQELESVLPHGVKNVIFVEEEVLNGGFGMSVEYRMKQSGMFENTKFTVIAPDDSFVIPKVGETVFHAAGVDAGQIADRIMSLNDFDFSTKA